MLAYRAVRAVIRAAVGTFFRDVHVTGREHIPAEGTRPVVFAGNHGNSLIDPALVIATSGRIVHFAARDGLFRPPLGLLLAAVGAVPIQRAMDHGAGPRDNALALAALVRRLASGRATGIFPEGLSHDAAHLQRLRTGAARVALQTAASGAAVAVVPVGLTYKHRKRFRSRVLVAYGPALDIGTDEVEAFAKDGPAASRALTDRIEAALRALTVNAPDWDTLRVLDAVRRMYQPPGISLADRVELARRFCDGHARVADQADVRALYGDVSKWLDDLDDAGLTDADLLRVERAGELPRLAVANLLRLAFWLPLALPSLPVHAPVLIGVGWAGTQFAPRNDVVGTTKVVLGLVAVPTLWALAVGATAWTAGAAAGLGAAVFLPISGLATLRSLERGASLRRLFRAARAAVGLSSRREALLRRRRDLETRIVDAVQKHLPAGMTPLFPR